MTTAGVLVVGDGRLRKKVRPSLGEVTAAAGQLDELIVVVSYEIVPPGVPEAATVLLDEGSGDGEASMLSVALDWCARRGHDVVVVARPGAAGSDLALVWRALAEANAPVVVFSEKGAKSFFFRLAAEAFPLVPLEGNLQSFLAAAASMSFEEAEGLLEERSARLGPGPDLPGGADVAAVGALLGRDPVGGFRVVVRAASGRPVVIENAPFLDDGTPMPTRYWLVGDSEQEAVGRLESRGGVRAAEAAVSAEELEQVHASYAAQRDALVPSDQVGPRPSGGVGGTRRGVKCLHAHLAHHLAGGEDPVGRWTAAALAGEIAGPVAALDCGTNSTRLLVTAASGETLVRSMTITRLGEDVDRTRRLGEEAISRTLSCLTEYRRQMDRNGVVLARCVATSAARDAGNRDDFLDRAEEVLAVRPEILDGEEEGRLAFLGATGGRLLTEPTLVVDLGGGSTELVVGGTEHDALSVLSLPLGCVRVSERFLHGDPPTGQELENARRHVREMLASATKGMPQLFAARAAIGLAGTVAALAVLSSGLSGYDPSLDGTVVLAKDMESTLSTLSALPAKERRVRRGVEEGRADVIVGGTIVLVELLEFFSLDEITYSEADLLDGIATELRSLTPP